MRVLYAEDVEKLRYQPMLGLLGPLCSRFFISEVFFLALDDQSILNAKSSFLVLSFFLVKLFYAENLYLIHPFVIVQSHRSFWPFEDV